MDSISDSNLNRINDYYSTPKDITTVTTTSTTSTTSTTETTGTTSYNDTSVGKYLNSTKAADVDSQTLFAKLSIDVGSDGKTITINELDSFISNADSGKVDISDNELSALKTLKENWNTISDGSSSITFANINASGSKGILSSMAPNAGKDTSNTDLINTTLSDTDKVYSSLIQSAVNSSHGDVSYSSSSLQSMLTTLLTGTTDANDDANAEMIANLTNLIATSNPTHTVEYRV